MECAVHLTTITHLVIARRERKLTDAVIHCMPWTRSKSTKPSLTHSTFPKDYAPRDNREKYHSAHFNANHNPINRSNKKCKK